ncbi:hypothetical protein BDA99DRAFT_535287 [Phascolomyces articulosus]|uniref:Uncharacterized protein n=1 Tax=Phascolomyces articulosus TaxID=60185 RepID=A0AAD5K5B0_9FUNG|nr:hypothetical protein BDA99DRAFT_535287 [Phascolomyces articulosus]
MILFVLTPPTKHASMGPKKDCYLYILVARYSTTGKVKPLAWMITNSEAQYLITHWLKWLKDELQYEPSRVMTDNPDTEILAINKAYNAHILRAWKNNILTKLIAKSSNPPKTLKDKNEMPDAALGLMMNMMRAETPVDFDLMLDVFELRCIENDDEWESADLYNYFVDEYDDKKEKWSKAWRPLVLSVERGLIGKFAPSTEKASAKILNQQDDITYVASFTLNDVAYHVNCVPGIGLEISPSLVESPSVPVQDMPIEEPEPVPAPQESVSQDAIDRFIYTFESLHIQVEKVKEHGRMPANIMNKISTSSVDLASELKSWNSSPSGPSEHQLRY